LGYEIRASTKNRPAGREPLSEGTRPPGGLHRGNPLPGLTWSPQTLAGDARADRRGPRPPRPGTFPLRGGPQVSLLPQYLGLAESGIYCGRAGSRAAAARWARRHLLSAVPHFHPPGSGILFRRSDIDQWLCKYRQEPIDLDAIIAAVLKPREPRPRNARGRYETKVSCASRGAR